MAELTTAEVVGAGTGIPLERASAKSLGRVGRLVATRDATVFFAGSGRSLFGRRPSEAIRPLGTLTVAAPTPAAGRALRRRLEVAIASARGGASGGQVETDPALVHTLTVLDRLALEDDEASGAAAVRAALEELLSAGGREPAEVVDVGLRSAELVLRDVVAQLSEAR